MNDFNKGSVVFKHRPEDFIVEEIWGEELCKISESPAELANAVVDFGRMDVEDRRDFLMCDVEKIGMDHFRIMETLARELHNYSGELGYAGTKDKIAWTCQRISIFNAKIERIRAFSFPGIKLKNFKWIKHKIKIGDLTANRFRVVLRDVDIDAIKFLNKVRHSNEIPNFFGAQRFGSLRQENLRIGLLIYKGKFQEALFEYLTAYGETESKEVIDAKRRLKTEKNMRTAKEYFPSNLRTELQMLEYIDTHPKDYAGALRIIGERTLLLMCQSVQSKMFNYVLERAIDERIPLSKVQLQLLGYNSSYSYGRIGELEREVLASYGLDLADFDVEELPFLSLNTTLRPAFFRVTEIEAETEPDELFPGSKKIMLTFRLTSGSYATTFLEQFFEFR